ncbi:unnamed protein product [Paramecium primaurelia]|uniref:DUF4485 domain-containing protein n=2 Tax=Paramecium TaxID=5884 RepID=A0A8S1WEP4_9CILI|nr:unnamed protein product [Paramecium primaurelia]CAD8187431.1 unnamed protein product [Paramecium pentaurelia]
MNSPRAETLDQELSEAINKIYNGCQKINAKHLKIRILQWLDKVRTPTHNFIWKQNSLLYARVLLEMTLEQQLDKPFRGVPPDGPLPRLDKFDVPQHIWQKIKQINIQQPMSPRKPLGMLTNRNFTPKLKTEPIQYKTNKFHNSQKSQKWDQIKETLEGANRNMREFKQFLENIQTEKLFV